MPTTVMLVRWHNGWSEVKNNLGIATFDRREALLSLGAQQSIGEVVRLASAELSGLFAKNREQMTAEHRPTDIEETPYIGYIPSDRVIADNFNGTPTLFPVTAMTVTEDENGEVTYLPQLGEIIVGASEFQRELRSTYSSRRPARRTPDTVENARSLFRR